MKAVIMAGGDGKRLRPLTCTKPKPLIPLLNRPILDYTMDLLAKHNINEAVFTLHYLGDMIKKHIGNGGAWGISASYSEPGRKLGTAGSVRAALKGREYFRRRILRQSNCPKRGRGECSRSER